MVASIITISSIITTASPIAALLVDTTLEVPLVGAGVESTHITPATPT